MLLLLLVALPLASGAPNKFVYLGGNDQGSISTAYHWPTTKNNKPYKSKMNSRVVTSNKNVLNRTEIVFGCPLKEMHMSVIKANTFSCYDLLYPTIQNDYIQCLKPDSCWTFGDGDCSVVPLDNKKNKYVGKDYDAAKKDIQENIDRVVTVSHHFIAKKPFNPKGILSMTKIQTKVTCCVLDDGVTIGSCRKLRMNKLQLLEYSLRNVTKSSIVRSIRRASITALKTPIYGESLNDLPSFEFDVEVCTLEGSDNPKCPLHAGTEEPSDFDIGCKKGLCAPGTKCDPQATNPEEMCIKCDDASCGVDEPKSVPHTVECEEDGSKCAVPENMKDAAKAVECTKKPRGPHERCTFCIEYDESDPPECKETEKGPAEFAKDRSDVACDNGGYCPAGSTCNPDATSVKDMCMKDGKFVEPTRPPFGTACRGGLCPEGTGCDKTTNDPTKVCNSTDGVVAPIFPPGVDCPGGRCPLGSVCNPAATSYEDMCLDSDGNAVKPLSTKGSKCANGGACPPGSKCDDEGDPCAKGTYQCAAMCQTDKGFLPPLFPGGVPCLGGLCPAGSKCNTDASSEDDMCLSLTGESVTPLRAPTGTENCGGGFTCPAGSTCIEGATDPKTMCKDTKSGETVSAFFPGPVKCGNGIVCPAGSACNPSATSADNACILPDGSFIAPVPPVPEGKACPSGSRCPADTECDPSGRCRDKNGNLVAPIFWGEDGGGPPAPRRLSCPGGEMTFKDVESPGPSPFVFLGYHREVSEVSDENACKDKCGEDRSCGQAVFVDGQKCYHHIVEEGDDICESKHGDQVIHYCSENQKSCNFYNKVCTKCAVELKLLGKIVFCHGFARHELLQLGKKVCGGMGEQEIAAVFS